MNSTLKLVLVIAGGALLGVALKGYMDGRATS